MTASVIAERGHKCPNDKGKMMSHRGTVSPSFERVGTAWILLAAGAVALSGCATSAAAQTSVDPLTCYIDNAGPSVEPDGVELRCGGGVNAAIELTDAQPSTDPSTSVGEWEVTRATVGTSESGSAIVRVFTENSGQSCTYYRDLADPAQNSSRDCKL